MRRPQDDLVIQEDGAIPTARSTAIPTPRSLMKNKWFEEHV